MNRKLPSLLAASTLALAAACSSSSDDGGSATPTPSPTPTGSTIVDVTDNVTADTHWTSANTYVLKNHIFVEAGTLTIDAGTRITGDQGSSLVITRDAKISAVGSASAPIVFTSSKTSGTRGPGDWGGLVLLGKASINVAGGENAVEGFPASYGDLIKYGAATPDDTHDCGTVSYVRIEYAGFELSTDNELNGLTVGACGSATNLDHIHVHKGADDGIEFFGGTANIQYALISQPDDDGLDWDYGWRGKGQFIVVQQNATVGNMGIEADNNGSANDATPRSMPTLYNLTFVGSDADPGMAGKKQMAMHLRRGTAGMIHNALITGFADGGIDIDGASTVTQANGGTLAVRNSIFFDNANTNDPALSTEPTDNDGGFDENAYLTGGALANLAVDPLLNANSTSLLAPNFLPQVGSPALTASNAATPPNDGFFDASATFIGAFGTTDWTAGWTTFPAN